MGTYWRTLRPSYTNEASYSATVTIDGSGSISGQTFTAELFDRSGASVADGTATVLSAGDRTVSVSVPGQETAGDYTLVVRRTDDSSGLVVFSGTVEVTDPAAPNAWGNP